jgi:hypothetical protein
MNQHIFLFSFQNGYSLNHKSFKSIDIHIGYLLALLVDARRIKFDIRLARALASRLPEPRLQESTLFTL